MKTQLKPRSRIDKEQDFINFVMQLHEAGQYPELSFWMRRQLTRKSSGSEGTLVRLFVIAQFLDHNAENRLSWARHVAGHIDRGPKRIVKLIERLLNCAPIVETEEKLHQLPERQERAIDLGEHT